MSGSAGRQNESGSSQVDPRVGRHARLDQSGADGVLHESDGLVENDTVEIEPTHHTDSGSSESVGGSVGEVDDGRFRAPAIRRGRGLC